MADQEAVRERARAMWTAGDWDGFSRHVAPVGIRLLDGIDLEPGMDLLDVGTGSGATVAIPAARRGAKVVGSDITPALLEHARRRRRGDRGSRRVGRGRCPGAAVRRRLVRSRD